MEQTTTVQIPVGLKNRLENLKDYARETYAEVIEKLVDIIAEDTMEFSEQTKKDIEEARKRIREGKFSTLEQVKRELKLK